MIGGGRETRENEERGVQAKQSGGEAERGKPAEEKGEKKNRLRRVRGKENGAECKPREEETNGADVKTEVG